MSDFLLLFALWWVAGGIRHQFSTRENIKMSLYGYEMIQVREEKLKNWKNEKRDCEMKNDKDYVFDERWERWDDRWKTIKIFVNHFLLINQPINQLTNQSINQSK